MEVPWSCKGALLYIFDFRLKYSAVFTHSKIEPHTRAFLLNLRTSSPYSLRFVCVPFQKEFLPQIICRRSIKEACQGYHYHLPHFRLDSSVTTSSCSTPETLTFEMICSLSSHHIFKGQSMQANDLIRVLELPHNRLPYILAQQIIEQNLYLHIEWVLLGRKCRINVALNGQDVAGVRGRLLAVVAAVREDSRRVCLQAARSSRYHQLYGSLDIEIGTTIYLCANIELNLMYWISKARC
ncbi:hypothetical protein J6590_024576 [Homalodisca vitripennis]|nr:hypothetical protein J6590_024576 [Homalodisca vitripennis]